ncbi:hypothetical protein TraAM80_01787 [Trypanosoma rangeli]|uniref:Uncharacterized protein n=1 Tax=Trypanosoma rangeli TaxID=5698 RepID=A0A422NXA9_TRYRA|nr:uncharacterized protein TraAM80_01787 [Trypanosoma rangeli]RNF10049.1 hypothetical protein TraAM80_01787 [Trypanosoma rangeli]|eukprot:RNF10049.1 hypothetical protein TraAM80_01787 [Trypanosoma rangeli]
MQHRRKRACDANCPKWSLWSDQLVVIIRRFDGWNTAHKIGRHGVEAETHPWRHIRVAAPKHCGNAHPARYLFAKKMYQQYKEKKTRKTRRCTSHDAVSSGGLNTLSNNAPFNLSN